MDQFEAAKDLGDAVVDRETEQGYTAGEWAANGNGVHVGTRCVAIAFDPYGRNTNTAVANARLIAAAPALYEALAGLAFSHNARDAGDPCWCSVRYEETHFERTGEHDEWCLIARAAFSLVIKPVAESAKRPISDETLPGQAS